jgi:hypothetical protein
MTSPKSTNLQEAEKRVQTLFDALKTESQRGRIIILGAHVDELLCGLLKKYLKRPRSKDDKLFGGMGPLGSFASRIEMAHRVGLISPQAAHCYDILRKLRNDCAHTVKPFSFDDGEHKASFLAFKEHTYGMSGIGKLLEYVEAVGDRTHDAVFNLLCIIHITILETHLNYITELPENAARAATLEEQRRFFQGKSSPSE